MQRWPTFFLIGHFFIGQCGAQCGFYLPTWGEEKWGRVWFGNKDFSWKDLSKYKDLIRQIQRTDQTKTKNWSGKEKVKYLIRQRQRQRTNQANKIWLCPCSFSFVSDQSWLVSIALSEIVFWWNLIIGNIKKRLYQKVMKVFCSIWQIILRGKLPNWNSFPALEQDSPITSTIFTWFIFTWTIFPWVTQSNNLNYFYVKLWIFEPVAFLSSKSILFVMPSKPSWLWSRFKLWKTEIIIFILTPWIRDSSYSS